MDCHQLKSEALKERQLLQKLAPGEDSLGGRVLSPYPMQFGLAIEYERSHHILSVRLFLSEMLRVCA